MIIYLTVAGLFVLTLLLPFLFMYIWDRKADKINNRDPHCRYYPSNASIDHATTVTCICLFFFGGGWLLCTLWCLIAGSQTATTVPEHIAEREVLVYRLDNLKDHVLEDVALYQDITAFNSRIYYAKSVDNNPWINWFVDRSWACIEPVELPA